MPVYEYKGIDSKGKKVTGVTDAENEKAGRIKLRRSGIFTTDIYLEGTKKGGLSGEVKGFSFLKGVKIAELAHMTRQLSTLLGANIPLVDSLSALQEQVENPFLKKSLSQIKDKVVEGRRLGDAMKAFPNIYNNLYITMIQAGEASGSLEQVLSRLAEFTEAQAKLTSKIRGAMTYPVIMSLVGTGLIMFLLVNVVPKIITIFEDTEMVLPLPTRILIFASNFAQSYILLILFGAVLLAYGVRRYIKTAGGRLKVDRMSLKMPVFGELFRKVAISRFSRTLATLLKSGVQLLPALDIVKNVVDNVVLTEAIDRTKNSVKEGESIAEPLRKSGEFPPLLIHMIAVGEKTGGLESMLEKVANSYDGEVDTTVGALTTLLEPLMIVVMGAIVAFIVLSILLPMLKMSQL